MKVLVDMNLSPRWCPLLRQAGHEAQHWAEIGPGDAPDEALMEYARRHDCVLLTHDLDFATILVSSQLNGPSVVQLREQDVLPETLGERVVESMAKHQQELS